MERAHSEIKKDTKRNTTPSYFPRSVSSPAFKSPSEHIMRLHQTIGNQAVERLYSSGKFQAINNIHPGSLSKAPSPAVIMRKERGTDAKKISDLVRDTWKVEPGNRSEEIIANDGKSYAGFQLLWFLYHKDATGNWFDWENIKKRATLAYDLKAANCDEYGDLSYSIARSKYNADSLVMEQQPGHTYAAMWDKEDEASPGKQSIIDPWVRRGHLREAEPYYMRNHNQFIKIKPDGQGWYKRGYTEKLKKAWVLEPWMTNQAKEGKARAEKKKRGEEVPGMY